MGSASVSPGSRFATCRLTRRDRRENLVGDPLCDAFRVWGSQRQDDVREAGVDRSRDRVPSATRVVVGDRQDEGSRDRSGIATDLAAEAVQESAALDGVLDVIAGEVPHVGMLGDDTQRSGGPSPDDYRRMRSLDRLGVAKGSGQVEVTAIEVERLG
jgi:hypothetical protein